MTALVFDTHAAATTLEEAGFSKAQVEALVEITRRTTQLPDTSELATKSDLNVLRSELKAEISAVKVQVIGVVISAMVIITTLGTFLGHLIR